MDNNLLSIIKYNRVKNGSPLGKLSLFFRPCSENRMCLRDVVVSIPSNIIREPGFESQPGLFGMQLSHRPFLTLPLS